MIALDPTWLDLPEADALRSLAGTVLAIALLVCVVVIAASAVAYAAYRVGWFRMGQESLTNLGRAVLASVVLGSLSGIVAFGAGLV